MSSTVASLPFLISHRTSRIQNPRFCFEKSVSAPKDRFEITSFFGGSLNLRIRVRFFERLKKLSAPISPIQSVVKRRKELPFDNVIQRDKKLKLVMQIRKILVSQPNRVMQLRDLGRFRKSLGLQKQRRFIALLKKFPGVFEVEEEEIYSIRVKLTPEAEQVYLEEIKVRNEMEDLLVVKIRKLLMMSVDKRILVEKIARLSNDLGLPLEFRETICERYPEYFRVVSTDRGLCLELTHWDPELAVSFAELEEREVDEQVKLLKNLKLSKSETRRVTEFRDMAYVSPYSDFSALRGCTLEKEKHACGVVHEILSLMVEKRTLVDHISHFREEFRFSQQFRGMLIRHPEMFYVSLKGDRDSVFLREAYRGSRLVEKNRLLVVKEKLRGLVSVPRVRGRVMKADSGVVDEVEDACDLEEEEGWSGFDGLLSRETSDEPLFEFNENFDLNNVGRVKNVEDEVVVPMFPDGRRRECW